MTPTASEIKTLAPRWKKIETERMLLSETIDSSKEAELATENWLRADKMVHTWVNSGVNEITTGVERTIKTLNSK